jgi:DNA invertase Pin-like site-specific DNA recombinase
MTRRAAIYTRISRDTEGEGLGVARQLDACRALAERESLTIVAEFSDNDVSAYSGKARPGFADLCDRLKVGDVDVVLAWAPDRITRQPRELEDLIDLLDSTSTTVLTVQAGPYDLSTPSGRMVARQLGTVARFESEHKSKRLRAKHEQLAAAGKINGGGWRPFGFNDDRLTIREDEAEALRWAVGEIVSGSSLRSVCKRMPTPTTTGKAWAPTPLRRLLISPRIAGLREHRGEIAADAVWPAIVEREQWELCRLTLTDPARKAKRPPHRYLLTGTLFDHHGRRFQAWPSDNGRRVYRTSADDSGPGVAIDAEGLEAMITEILSKWAGLIVASGVTFITETPTAGTGDLSVVTNLEAEMSELARMHGEGAITLAEWMAARRPLEDRLAAARADLPKPGKVLDISDYDSLPDWPFERRRNLVHGVFERIVIHPGVRGRNTFDRSRVKVKLRQPSRITFTT